MAETVKQFHADQRAQKEIEELRGKLGEIEKMMKVMKELPGFEKLIKEAARSSKEE